MKKERNFPSIIVTKKQESRIRRGHPWVYEEEIKEMPFNIENGCLLDVMNEKHQYLGTGLYSAHSKIKVRILDKNANEAYEKEFFMRRMQYAISYRANIMKEDFSCCRLVHGEADGLPGVTMDLYKDVVVSEILSFGMDMRKDWLYEALKLSLEKEGIVLRGIYERSDSALREKEGLPKYCGWVDTEGPNSVVINECGLQYEVDIVNGQKTGFFLDQKYNRLIVREFAQNKKVLDCCTHTGSFALNAVLGQASQVTAVDISQHALESAKKNASLNGFEEKITFVQEDVFAYLEKAKQYHQKYDLIILDPPAFTKSSKTKANAKKGYEQLNSLAMQLLPRGGYLVTCSCSHYMDEHTFEDMLVDASIQVNRQVKLIAKRYASPDHPVLFSIPETAYLKFYLVQII